MDKQEALQHGATNNKPCYMERASKTAQDEQPLTTANHQRVVTVQRIECKAHHVHSWVTSDHNTLFKENTPFSKK